MSSPPPGTGARRSRRGGRAALALAGLVVLAAAVAVVIAVRTTRSATVVGSARATAAPEHARTHAHDRRRQRDPYGSVAADPGKRVRITFDRPPRAGLLFDLHSGRVLWSRNPGRLLPIASLTKMMTALIVVRRLAPDAHVKITREAVNYTGSGIGLLPKGKRVKLRPLLYGLLLPSGNDAAIALAQKVSGSVKRFVALMNRRARRMGLTCTRFASPSGIIDAGNHSCARDLARLAHAVLSKPRLARIVGSRSIVLPFPIKGGKLYLYNNNRLLKMGYPGVDGIKTGYTDAAGRSYVISAHRGHAGLGVVLLHSIDPPSQGARLLEAGFRKLGAPPPRTPPPRLTPPPTTTTATSR